MKDVRFRFQNLLGKSFWVPSDSQRYGYPRNYIVPFKEVDFKDSKLAVLSVNQYLLDGYVRSELPSGFQKSFPSSGSYFPPTSKDHISVAVRSAIHIRLEQYLLDGNHRTATFLLYEYLAQNGVEVQLDPLIVYVWLSLAEEREVEDIAGILEKEIRRRRSGRSMDYHQVVKELPVLASQVYLIVSALRNERMPLSTRREECRWLKRHQPIIYVAASLIHSQGKSKTFNIIR